ncbi:hypothetical protein [Streptomyces sp. NPDC048357]|uniref:hypothetical protein n=1 Tax=Streptomyces sp. NPDC048357 TaxID=3154719 RepID=UPI00341966A1
MLLPAEAVAATALIEVIRLNAPPARPGRPFTGDPVGHWAGAEAESALSLIESLPGSGQHRCGFHPGWALRAYEATLSFALFEAQFCFSCQEVRLHGSDAPPALSRQFFDPNSPQAQTFLAHLRGCAQ